jgi:bis(5'-nucleosyl)-tetraphosphatase (symmetrical)
MRRTITVGDIHGCLDEFDELMKQIEYKRGEDRLVLLGDLIDRGPDPAGVVRRAFEIGAESIMGNHEEKALRWRRHEQKRKADPTHYKNPMSKVAEARLAQWKAIPDEHWEWMSKWPVSTRITESWSAVHGGCLPGYTVERQKPNELMRMRYLKIIKDEHGYETYKMASLNEKGEAPDNCVHWTTVWEGPDNVVYGHYTRDDIHVTEGPGWTLGIDTGCVHGKFLTAAIFFPNQADHMPGFEIQQVAAKQVYVPRGPWNDAME